MDQAGPFGCQFWVLLLLSYGPAKALVLYFFCRDWKPMEMMAQPGLRDAFISPLSHPGLRKHNHSSAATTPFLNLLTSPWEGEAGQAQIQGHAKTHLLGENSSSPSSLLPVWRCGWAFVWKAWSPVLPWSISHQSNKTFQQITWHFVKT